MTVLAEGMYVRTSYGTGPYRIVDILRGCTCPSYLDTINLVDPPPSPPHIHLSLRKPFERRGVYSIGGIDEQTLKCVWSDDQIFIVDAPKPKQLWLFKEDEWKKLTLKK